MIIRRCLLCESKKLKLAIDLGHHPLADSFLPANYQNKEEITYPLRVQLCQDCGHAMLQYTVPSSDRYQKIDYSYTSSNSPVAIAHFQDMAKDIIKRIKVTDKDLVIDIGSNTGTLLEAFNKQSGCKILGIEPAPNIVKIARKNNIPTLAQFFDRDAAKKIVKRGKAKIITATNVFNHIDNIREFIKNIKFSLADDGVFIFEVPYLFDLLKKISFDTIYLEHISYFGIKPLNKFFRKNSLYISHIEDNDYMGGTIRIYIGKKKAPSKIIKKYICQEEKEKNYNLKTYEKFMNKVHNLKFKLCQKIYQIKSKNNKIIAIGAATKGNTLLNYCKIDNSLIEFITDSSPLKIGKLAPGSHIPIKSDKDITPDIKYALILPWNIGGFLKKKLKHLNLQFIIPSIK